jgi:integrase
MLDGSKIERVRLHDARHTCRISRVPIAVIAARLGHASAALTMARIQAQPGRRFEGRLKQFLRNVTSCDIEVGSPG